MKILFLGTSSGWPISRLGCTCKLCTSNDPKNKRLRPSLLINDSILVDASPDIYYQIQKYKIDPTKITHILITHPHEDHVMGLYDLSHIYNRAIKISLIATRGVLSQMRKLVGISMQSLAILEAKPKEKINLGKDSFAWFIPVDHGAIDAFGIKIKAPRSIFYAPEFRKISASSRKFLGDCDLVVFDGSSKTPYGRAKNHETIEEGIRLGKDLKVKKVLFTNIGHKTDIYKNLENFVQKTGGKKFGISFDGLAIKL